MMKSKGWLVSALLVAVQVDAALDFKRIDSADNGIGDVLEAHYARVNAAGGNVWAWGPVAWSDPSGSYVYIAHHHGKDDNGNFLFKRNAQGNYHNITPEAPASDMKRPAETRPVVMDVDNNGLIDLIHTGNEARDAVSLLNVAGRWMFSRELRVGWGGRSGAMDINADGYLDIQNVYGSTPWGATEVRTAINVSGTAWDVSAEPLVLPADMPADVKARIERQTGRYHKTDIYPMERGYLVTHGGSYNINNPEKFHYLIIDGVAVDAGLPGNGMALRPIDLNGDGHKDIPIQDGDAYGVYFYKNGRFEKDTAGDMPIIDRELDGGPYAFEFWGVDFDADGDGDFVFNTLRLGRGYIMENNGGVFTLKERIMSTDGQGVYVADVDGDLDLDIIATGGGRAEVDQPKRNSQSLVIYENQANIPTPSAVPESPAGIVSIPLVEPKPALQSDPARQPDPEHDPEVDTAQIAPSFFIAIAEAFEGRFGNLLPPDVLTALLETTASIDPATGGALEAVRESLDGVEPQVAPEPVPEPDPIEPLASVVVGNLPLPDHDPTSKAWATWVATVARQGGRAAEHALIAEVTGSNEHCTTAIEKAQALVDVDSVSRNQYLNSGREYPDVFSTLAWCDVPTQQAAEWAAWGKRHLGATDGSVKESIWFSNRWSRNNPANNYYHSFIRATSVYAMATSDQEWLNFLKNDRLPLMTEYYEGTPEGGSREGTGYGESHRNVLGLEKLWRDYDSTSFLPQEFIDGTVRFWVHAIAPGGVEFAPIGDQARTKGRVDGFHCDVFDNALPLLTSPQVREMAQWQLSQLRCNSSHVFAKLFLRDYPEVPRPSMPLEYYAKGAGVLFIRDGWAPDSTFMFFTAGIRDEAHQCEDQGGFAVWAKEQWQTVADHPWTASGLCNRIIDTQNVVRFPGVNQNIRNSQSTLAWSKNGGSYTVDMELSAAVGQPWTRRVTWRGGSELGIVDRYTNPGAIVGFEAPGADDKRARTVSAATASTQYNQSSASTVVRW